MDALTSILLYACAAVAVAGAMVASIAPAALRSIGLLLLAIGTAAALAVLSAGFAAVAFLVVGIASALLLDPSRDPSRDPSARFAGTSPPSGEETVLRQVASPPSGEETVLRQVGGIVAAGVFAVLAYAAFKGSFGHGAYPGGFLNSAAVGRLLLDRDALAGVAVGGMLLVAVAGAAASWRTVRR